VTQKYPNVESGPVTLAGRGCGFEQEAGEPEQLTGDHKWTHREEQFREQEWEAAQRLLTTARVLLRRVLFRPESAASLTEISRLLDLASKLGRLATGLANHREEISGPDGGPIRVEFERALQKIYGEPEKDESVSPVNPNTPSSI
jgi:hypothetical protein